MPIRQLPEDLINRIAAGEVVERPASVVKELVENAIDAGARRVAISTAGGGISLMRIEDDGVGMDEADLLLSVERHATSKLADDGLDDIRTLGFRGEALASIGSVAELTISTRQADAETGLRLAVRHGAKARVVPVAMNRGTIVEVRELFANVPARRKFLKTERAEAGAITDVVKRLAMANPGVQFVLDGADRSASNWPGRQGDGALRARLGDVMGADFGENAVPLATVRHGVVVTGLAGLPTFSRANSLSQYFFVNGRSVKRQGAGGGGAGRLRRFRVPRPVSGGGAVRGGGSGRGGCECASGESGTQVSRCRGGARGGDPGDRRGVGGGGVSGGFDCGRRCGRGVSRAGVRGGAG